MIGVTVIICGLCALIVNGDKNRVVTVTNATITLYPNDYITEWTSHLQKPPNENSIISMTLTAAQDLPGDLKIHSHVVLNTLMPMTRDDDFCAVMDIEAAKKRFPNSESVLPEKCPFPAGSYSLLGLQIQTKDVPRSIPDCHFFGSMVTYYNDITQPWARIEFEGEYAVSDT